MTNMSLEIEVLIGELEQALRLLDARGESLAAIKIEEAIHILRDRSFVEIKADKAKAFFAALGPRGMLEKGVNVTKLDKPPDFSDAQPEESQKPRRPRRQRTSNKGEKFEASPHKGERSRGSAEEGGNAKPRKPRPKKRGPAKAKPKRPKAKT